MFLERFHEPRLGHASCLLGSESAGAAIVVDPRRDVEGYLRAAGERGVRITHLLDTHGHNDYLSGLAELASRTEAEVLASAHGEVQYDHRPVKDGATIEVGEALLEVLHTPGHTPEHIGLLVFDTSVTSDEPAILLSGGSLLVGDVARPDLLGGPEEVAEAARAMCRTLAERILTLPDHVEVFPTHVAGSLCAGSIGARLSTTIGFERRTNPSLVGIATGEVVEDCLDMEHLPAVPPYWGRMRPQNLAGVALLGPVDPPSALLPDAVEALAGQGATVVDTRDYAAFGAAHVPGALNVGLGGSFPTWAGTVLEEGARVVLVADGPHQAMEATWHLLRIGYDRPVGWLPFDAWRTSGRAVAAFPVITIQDLRERLDELRVLDVRQPAEWEAGHIEGAIHITGAEILERIEEIPREVTAVVCSSGYRSGVSASVLARAGRPVANVMGGMTAWEAAGFPTTR